MDPHKPIFNGPGFGFAKGSIYPPLGVLALQDSEPAFAVKIVQFADGAKRYLFFVVEVVESNHSHCY